MVFVLVILIIVVVAPLISVQYDRQGQKAGS
jgi:hypothetical protein